MSVTANSEKQNQVELSGSGSRVDIVSIPCAFHAPNYNLLDQLFIPLLCSAQQANDLMGLRLGDDQSALRASSYMAGELLRDNSLIPIRSFSTGAAHAYRIDFTANQFHAETVVFNQSKGTSSMFRVTITGAIRGDKFVVADPVTGLSLFSFTRFEAEKSDFFIREFPFLAHESRKDPTMDNGNQDSLDRGVIDLLLGVPVGDKTLMTRIQKQAAASSVEVKLQASSETVMTLPLASLSNIPKLIETVGKYLAANPSGTNKPPE